MLWMGMVFNSKTDKFVYRFLDYQKKMLKKQQELVNEMEFEPDF